MRDFASIAMAMRCLLYEVSKLRVLKTIPVVLTGVLKLFTLLPDCAILRGMARLSRHVYH